MSADPPLAPCTQVTVAVVRPVAVAFNPVGQVVGQFEKVEKTAAVIERWVNEYLEATSHLDALNAAAAR